MLTVDQKAAALHCSTALGCLDVLMSREKEKSAPYNRLKGAVEAVNRCVDLYRLESFSFHDMKNASYLLDQVNRIIVDLYPTERMKQATRRAKRHNQCRVERVVKVVPSKRRKR